LQPEGRESSEWGFLDSLIDRSSVTTLLCDGQESKLQLLSRLIDKVSDQSGVTVYIDLDTSFTVFLERCRAIRSPSDLSVLRPRGEDLDDTIAGVCSLNLPILKLIIFDSTTAFYNLLGRVEDTSNLNIKLGLYLAILKRVASRSGGRLVFTSMRRARREESKGSWRASYSGGRILKRRSDLILELNMDGKYMAISVVKCREASLQGRIFRFQP